MEMVTTSCPPGLPCNETAQQKLEAYTPRIFNIAYTLRILNITYT